MAGRCRDGGRGDEHRLGLLQVWAESSLGKWLFTICSHSVRPSDEMLAWLSALPNIWVGHTVSAWLSSDELEVRLRAIERFIAWGIPSAVWIATRDEWDNAAVLERARGLVPDDLIIEVPYRCGTWHQNLPLLGVNPLGACSDQRYGSLGGPVDLGEVRGDRADAPPSHVHARCRGCRLRCGLVPLRALGLLTRR